MLTAPRKMYKIPSIWEEKKWFSTEIREAADKRDAAYRKALYEDTKQNWSQFKSERNAVISLIRKTKKEYYKSMIDNKLKSFNYVENLKGNNQREV